MKDQILQILEEFSLTSAQFADIIGVQRSSISHILSGRNKPSYDFILKIHEHYPEISADWLLTGHGNMFKHKSEKNNLNLEQNLFNQPLKSNEKTPVRNEIKDVKEIKAPIGDDVIQPKNTDRILNKNSEVTNVNYIKQVIFVYNDNTFEIIDKR